MRGLIQLRGFVTCRFGDRPTYILHQYISSFRRALYHIAFSPVFGELEFRIRRCNMTYLEMKMKDLGALKWYSQHNIVDPYLWSMSQKSCSRKKPPGRKSINTHTQTHTHMHTHTHVTCMSFIWRNQGLLVKLLKLKILLRNNCICPKLANYTLKQSESGLGSGLLLLLLLLLLLE